MPYLVLLSCIELRTLSLKGTPYVRKLEVFEIVEFNADCNNDIVQQLRWRESETTSYRNRSAPRRRRT